jgi:excisionase family DNA binding protein
MQTNGQSLLTARQVQAMFGVDRSTVYRMAEDGRLPALKIGRQWRFRPEEIERLLVANPGALVASPSGALVNEAMAALPDLPDSVAAVVEVAADLLGVMMVAADMQGRPLTGVANPSPWFTARGDDPDRIADCVADWKMLADEPDFEPQFRTGQLGFQCARAYIRSGTSLVGMVLAGGVAPPGDDSDELYHLDPVQRSRVLAALPKVAAALSRAIASQQPSRQ